MYLEWNQITFSNSSVQREILSVHISHLVFVIFNFSKNILLKLRYNNHMQQYLWQLHDVDKSKS